MPSRQEDREVSPQSHPERIHQQLPRTGALTINSHLQLPLLFTVFERKIQFPRQVCSVVTRSVLLTFRGKEVQGRVRNPIQGCGLSCPLVNRGGKWVSPSHISFHLSFPDVRNVLMLLPASTKGHLPHAGKHRSFSHLTPSKNSEWTWGSTSWLECHGVNVHF